MSDLQRELREMHERLGRILAGLDRPRSDRRMPPPGERFDFANHAHRIAAEEVFDDLQINERRRGWLYNNVLNDGVFMSELRAVIEQQDATFRRRYPFAVGRRDGSKSNWNGQWPKRN